MTAQDIVKIVLTVSVAQCTCDLISRRLVFNREPYQRALSAFERAKAKRDKTVASGASNEKSAGAKSKPDPKSGDKSVKKIQRAEDDLADAAAQVAQRHTVPSLLSSVLFLVLYRVMSADYAGKVIAVLPFEPWNIVQRITRRGLGPIAVTAGGAAAASSDSKVDPTRACGFLFVYVLCTLSVKFILHKLCGVQAPEGANKGVGTILDTPKSQKMLKSFGVNTEEFNEIRKSW